CRLAKPHRRNRGLALCGKAWLKSRIPEGGACPRGRNRCACGAPQARGEIPGFFGDEIAHQPSRYVHRPTQTTRAGERQEPRVDKNSRQGAREHEGLTIVLAQKSWPDQGEAFICAQKPRSKCRGFEPIINALAIERIHARGSIADNHPVGARHIRHRTTHGEGGGCDRFLSAKLPLSSLLARVL